MDYISTLAVTANAFAKQMGYLVNRYQVLSLTEACALLEQNKTLDKDCVVITCDDGYADNYTKGQPVFERFKIHPTIYLTTGYIDSQDRIWHDQVDYVARNSRRTSVNLEYLGVTATLSNNTDKSDLAYILMQKIKRMPPADRQELLGLIASELDTAHDGPGNELLTWPEVRLLAQAGCEIGAHTVTHSIMSSLTQAKAREELINSKAVIEKETGRPCRHFAYPDGNLKDIDARCESLVREIYRSAVTTEPGVNYPGCDLHRLRRIGVIKEMDVVYLKVKILMTKLLK